MTQSAPSIARPFGGIARAVAVDNVAGGLLPLLRVRSVHAVLVTLLIVVQYSLQMAASLSDRPGLLAEVFLQMFARNVVYWIVGFAIIALVQTLLPPGRVRTIVLILSVLCCGLIWAAFWQILVSGSTFIVVEIGLTTNAGLNADASWTNATYLLFAAWYYESADRARRSTATQRQSELQRRGAERWLLELRLRSLQARLDPQVLFDTLDEAGRLYRTRPDAAEKLVECLIHYLRRALPQVRQAQSTLEREVELGLAYLRLLRASQCEALDLEVDIEAAVADARFPPMVVQPLCDVLARPAFASGGQAQIVISATRKLGWARLHLSAQPVQSAPSHARLEEIHHTLVAMFGLLARIDAADATAGVASLVIEVPYDAASRADS